MKHRDQLRAHGLRIGQCRRHHAEVIAIGADLEDELNREGRRLEAEAEALRRRLLQTVESEARAQVLGFDGVPDGRVAELAREVVALVAGGVPP